MKRFLLGAVAAGGATYTIRRIAPKIGAMHEHCRELMRDRGGDAGGCCRPG